jgi:hypothetical protein
VSGKEKRDSSLLLRFVKNDGKSKEEKAKKGTDLKVGRCKRKREKQCCARFRES